MMKRVLLCIIFPYGTSYSQEVTFKYQLQPCLKVLTIPVTVQQLRLVEEKLGYYGGFINRSHDIGMLSNGKVTYRVETSYWLRCTVASFGIMLISTHTHHFVMLQVSSPDCMPIRGFIDLFGFLLRPLTLPYHSAVKLDINTSEDPGPDDMGITY